MSQADGPRYELNNPPVISEVIDGEVVAIDLDAGNYFSLRGPAVAVWSALLDGAAPRDIVAAAATPGAEPALADALELFVERLLADRLLRPRNDTGGAPVAVAPLQAWSRDELDYECFTDMQNLLGLDPIHEADDRLGWPVQQT